MSSTQLLFSCALALALVVSVICGTPAVLAAEEQAEEEQTAEESCEAALPEWAPEEPSEEFLRAVEVLGFLPTDELERMRQTGPEMEAFVTAVLEVLWPRAFELFGALTDEEVEEFRAHREVRLFVPSLPPPQKTALDSWIEAASEVAALVPGAGPPGQGLPPEKLFLALLREEGAAEDLSNVDVGFAARGGVVGVYFWSDVSDSGAEPVISNDFATLKPKEGPSSSE
jgi:hypothetical protein